MLLLLLLLIVLATAIAPLAPTDRAATPPDAAPEPAAQAAAPVTEEGEIVVPPLPADGWVSKRTRYTRTERNVDGSSTLVSDPRPLHW